MPESLEKKTVFLVGPTESLLTQRGNRHPALAQFLVEEGYDLEYVTSNFYHAEKRWFSQEEIAHAERRAPYKLIVLRCFGYHKNLSPRRMVSNFLFSLRVLFYLLPRVSSESSIVAPSRPVEIIFMMAILRLFRGSSVALDIQDIWPDMLPVKSRVKRAIFTVYCSVFLYPSLRFIDKFFHVAPSFVEWLHRYAPKSRSVFVPLGFDAERWRVQGWKTTTPGEPIRLVCVTMLTRVFDVMPMLEAITGNTRYHLTLIGDEGEGERYAEVVTYIKTHQMCNVAVVGRVDRELMGKHLVEADIGVVPMLASSIPNKVFDYIGGCLPILVLGDNDSADLVNKLDIGWSCPYNSAGVKQWLKAIDQEDVARKRANLLKVRDRFDRRNLFQVVRSLLESDTLEHLPPDTIPTLNVEEIGVPFCGTRKIQCTN